jgi:uncharacterized membrane protein
MEHPGFSVGVIVRYVLLPTVVLGLITLWQLRRGRPGPSESSGEDRAVWWLIAAFVVVYVTMSVLRYLAYRTTIQDLGVYDQRIWALSNVWPFPTPARIVATFGHFSPIVALHVLAYKVYPSAVVLLGLQIVAVGLGAYPVYHLARPRLGRETARALAASYLLYPSVVFTVLFDFHPDHLIIPLLLFAFYFLELKNLWGVGLAGLAMLLVKESLVPTVAAFGVYALLVTRRYLLGALFALGSVAFLWFLIMPWYPGLFAGAAGGESYGYLGASLPEIVKTFVTSPGVWLPEIAEVPKLKFLFLMLAPLLFLPLLAPVPLLVALPGLLMALLSRHPHRYQIWAQYVAPLIPPLFVATVWGFQRLGRRLESPRWRKIGALLPWWMIGTAVYFNVVFSPSPLSTAFWMGQPEWLRWPYHFRAYLVTSRERELRAALERLVPADAAVASQNNINSSPLAHRAVYVQFPSPGAFVVVDTKRPMFVFDRVDPKEFLDSVERFRRERPTVYESDGVLIFGPSLPGRPR